MIRSLRVIVFLVLAVAGNAQAQQDLQLTAHDGVTVYGDFVAAPGNARGTILLFHQARSNRGEYATIAPELVRAGYNVLAIDQRAGGAAWNRLNFTAQGAGQERSSYTKTLADLQAALDYAAALPTRPIIAWGSGYSASLVFLLAASHPDLVAAVLAFSPAENFAETSVHEAAMKLKCPVFITSSSDLGEVGDAKKLFDAIPAGAKTQLIPQHGLTGSPTLRREANPRGAAANWTAVQTFLAAIGKKPA
jgi:dienelactone hydrolase